MTNTAFWNQLYIRKRPTVKKPEYFFYHTSSFAHKIFTVSYYIHNGSTYYIRDRFPFVLTCQLNWGGPSDETAKTEVPCHRRCGTIKTPTLLKLRRYGPIMFQLWCAICSSARRTCNTTDNQKCIHYWTSFLSSFPTKTIYTSSVA